MKVLKVFCLFIFNLVISSSILNAQIPDTASEAPVMSEDGATATRYEVISVKYELLDELQKLLNKIDKIDSERKQLYKKEYDEMYLNIISAVEVSDKLSSVYNDIDTDIAQASIYNTIARVNSPTSDALGFEFTDIIVSQAKQIFDTPNQPPEKKKKFFKIIDKITNSPIVSDISKSSPFVGMVRSVVTAASALFTKPNVDIEVKKRSSGNVREVIVRHSDEQEFKTEELKLFVSKMQPYISFYEKLEYSNLEFEVNINTLLEEYRNLPSLIAEFEDKLLADLGLIKGLPLVQKVEKVNEIFNYRASSGSSDFDYFVYINNPSIIDADNRAKQLVSIVFQLERLYAEYASIVETNYRNNIQLIDEEARNLPGADKNKIDLLISQLTSLTDKVVQKKFKRDIESIQELRRKISF